MRVAGVNIFAYKKTAGKCPAVAYAQYNPLISPKREHDIFERHISFGANPISTYGQYRFLTKNHDIHCIYCRGLMVYGGLLTDMLNSGVFSRPIKDFVETVKPYRKYMKKGQKQVFDQIQKHANKSPQTHLSQIIEFMYQKSIKRLVRVQSHIFKQLIEESKNLPEKKQQSFRKFMRKQHRRLYEIPCNEEFNPQKFSYKVSKMIQSIPNEELKAYITRIIAPLAEPIFENRNNVIPIEIASQITKRKLGKFITAKDFSEYVIRRVKTIGIRLNRQDIVRLCKTSQDMIDGKPVIIPFSNKEFMKELVEIQLADIKKSPLYYSMVNIANKLPNSKNSQNSFVVKHRYSDSDTIGYKLLEPSITTIEHVKARFVGGVEDLTNCVLACKADNNERGSVPMHVYLRKWNKRSPQTFFNDIIKISNEEQLINPTDIEGMAQSVLNEGHIEINTTKLKK